MCGRLSQFFEQHGRKILLTVFLLVFIVALGIVFFGLSEGVYGDFETFCEGQEGSFKLHGCVCEPENKNDTSIHPPFCARPFTDATYWTMVTMFTVGYGDWGLQQPRSIIFSTFYLILSTAVLCISIGNFYEIYLVVKEEKMMKDLRQTMIRACSSKEAFEEMVKEVEAGDPYKGDEVRVEQKGVANRVGKCVNVRQDRTFDVEFEDGTRIRKLASRDVHKIGDGSVDKGEFLSHCLVKMNLVDRVECDRWLGQFKELDEDGSGFLDADDLAALAEREEKEKIQQQEEEEERKRARTASRAASRAVASALHEGPEDGPTQAI